MNNPEEKFRRFEPDYSGMNVREVVYATLTDYYGQEKAYSLDVITSQTVPQHGRFVFFIHGGAFSQPCDKRQAYICLFARALTAEGYTVIAPDYPVFNDASELRQEGNQLRAYRQSAQAVNAAYDYVVSHADSFGIVPGKAAIMGGSAGSMASFYAACERPEYYEALVNLWGPPDPLPDLSRCPRVLSVHGTDDKVVPYALEEMLAQELERFHIPHELITLEGCGHTPIGQMASYMPAILRFLERTRA